MDSTDIVVMTLLKAIESRDVETVLGLFHPEIAFHWQPGLPYEGDHRGAEVQRMMEVFAGIWEPLRPDQDSRNMNPQILATSGETVIAEYEWGGRRADGTGFTTRTLARYQVRNGLVRDARMFHYDLIGVIRFIAEGEK